MAIQSYQYRAPPVKAAVAIATERPEYRPLWNKRDRAAMSAPAAARRRYGWGMCLAKRQRALAMVQAKLPPVSPKRSPAAAVRATGSGVKGGTVRRSAGICVMPKAWPVK